MSGFPDAAASNRIEPDSDSHHTWAPKNNTEYIQYLIDKSLENSMEN